MRQILTVLILSLWPLTLAAQEAVTPTDDRDFLTGFLESSLSDLGRTVTIEGFQGALSSRATFTRLTIADDSGVWLTITDGALSWSRAALITGAVEIDELSAASIDIARKPSGKTTRVEAAPFALPELPISLRIGKLHTDHLHLGTPILGEAADFTISGAAELAGGQGKADLAILRTGATRGDLTIKAAFDNATRVADIDLALDEGPGGIAAKLLNLPGAPQIALTLRGNGPLSGFSTDLKLATDGQDRLTGTLKLQQADASDPAPGQSFSLSLAGDITPLLQPDYQAFFGPGTRLDAEGARRPDGRIDLRRVVLSSRGLDLSGRLSLLADHTPQAAALTLRFGLPDQTEMLLPVPGAATYVRHGTMILRFDADKGDVWRLAGDLSGYRGAGLALGALTLDGNGRVLRNGTTTRLLGQVGFDATGLAPTDPALGAALGPTLRGRTGFSWSSGQPLRLHNLAADAGDLTLAGDLALTRQGLDLRAEGDLTLAAADVSRFSGLAGRPLSGRADGTLKGQAMLLSRAFDLTAEGRGTSLATGTAALDQLLAGQTRITLSALRDATGLTLRGLTVSGAGFNADANGRATSGDAEFTASLDAKGLHSGIAAADTLLAGHSDLSLSARAKGGTLVLADARLTNDRVTITLSDPDLTGTWQTKAKLADAADIVTGFPGPATLSGTIAQTADAFRLDLTGQGPGQMAARIAGQFSADFARADLTAKGRIQAAALNNLIAPRSADGTLGFDLTLDGPLAISALTGRITGANLRIASPSERLSAAFPNLTATLRDGQAQLTGQGEIRGGGKISLSGPVTLAAPYTADLTIGLQRAAVSALNMFATEISGNVTLNGPLFGGAMIAGDVTLDRTEIIVAAPGFDDQPIPEITHLNEGQPSALTRHRARLDRPSGAATGGVIYGLDLNLSAPGRIFVRGRGLDAEMAGQLHLGGTTADMVPTGRFTMIRGRLDLLGKRLKLESGIVQLQGSFVPYLNFSATADAFGNTTTVVLQGPVTAPDVHASSTSGLPEDEVLSQLLFGQGFDRLSAFQLAQLANAIATLSGRGSDLAGRIRKALALDSLDVTADDSGNAAIRAGKYLSDTLYGEGTVTSDGKAKIELDLDVGPDLTLRGTAGTDGQTGVGVFYNHDY